MSNQVYKNLETRERYRGTKRQFYIQLDVQQSTAPTPNYTEHLIIFNDHPTTNTGHISWDNDDNSVVCQTEGVFNIQATVSFHGGALPLEVVELFFIVDGLPLPAYGITSVPRTNATIDGDDAEVITASYTFNAVVGTTVQTLIRSKGSLIMMGPGGSTKKRTYLTCVKIN